jgi:hypothetical protein
MPAAAVPAVTVSPMRGRLVLAGLCAMLAAACSTTVSGRATFAGGTAGPAPSGSTPGGPGQSGSASTSPAPADTGTSGQGDRQALNCGSGGKVISPSGSPYCYLVPAGFVDVSSSVTVDTTVGSEKFRSAVAVADRDLVIVTVYQLRLDTDEVSDNALASELQGVLKQLSNQGFQFDSTTARRSTVDGARAFGYHAREAKNKLQADVYFIFRTKVEVEINCQWQLRRADVTRACQQIMTSLQIKSVK